MKTLKALLVFGLATFMYQPAAQAQEARPIGVVEQRSTPDDPNNNDPGNENPVGIVENSVQDLKIYPNPSIGSNFTIDVPLADDENIALFIYDMNGRVVERKSGSYAELRHFRMRNLDEATYIIKVFSKNALFQSRVMVVH